MNKTTLIIATILGSIVNGFFYYFAFTNLGFQWLPIALTMTLTFSVVEIALWINKTPWFFMIFKIGLLAFSIQTTQTGQFFASSVMEVSRNANVTDYVDIDTQIEELKEELELYSVENQRYEIEMYTKQIDNLNYQLNQYIRQGLDDTEEDRERIDSQKETIQENITAVNNKYQTNRNRISLDISSLRESRRNSNLTAEAPRDAYDFYSDKYGVSKEQAKSWAQTLTAILLAFVAPGCLYILRKMKEPEKEPFISKVKEWFSKFNKQPESHYMDNISNDEIKEMAIDILKKEPTKEGDDWLRKVEKENPHIVHSENSFSEEIKKEYIDPYKDPPKEPEYVLSRPKSDSKDRSRKERQERINIIAILYSNITKGVSDDLLSIQECIKEFQWFKENKHPNLEIPDKDIIAGVIKEIIDNNLAEMKSWKEVIRRIA